LDQLHAVAVAPRKLASKGVVAEKEEEKEVSAAEVKSPQYNSFIRSESEALQASPEQFMWDSAPCVHKASNFSQKFLHAVSDKVGCGIMSPLHQLTRGVIEAETPRVSNEEWRQ
jgi:hypothetical protein